MVRVVDALYREDHLGLTSTARPVRTPDGLPARHRALRARWWASPLPCGGRVLAPMRPDGFLADHRLAAPILLIEGPGTRQTLATRLAEVLTALAPRSGPDDHPAAATGWADFADECHQALAVARLRIPVATPLPADSGYRGLLRYEAVAAATEHPVHPFARCRVGLTTSELRRYAAEFCPRFRLRWSAVPREGLTASGSLPPWWPVPSSLGMPASLDDDHLAIPVHPVTADRGLAAVAGRPSLVVVPTLSTRTVASVDEASVQLKLPLPIATLGARNRRAIKAGTLGDGATVHRLLGAILDREPRLAVRVLLADESTWLHTGDEYLAVLVRRMPPELDGCTLVPVAALPAQLPGGSGRTVLADLATRYPGGLSALIVDYLDTLFDWHLALWLRYGVALESHGQNVILVVDPGPGGGPRLRLLYKDNDGARVDHRRLASALGDAAGVIGDRVGPRLFTDSRIVVSDERELADVFTTITLHLCAAAPMLALANDPADPQAITEVIRTRLDAAADRWHDGLDPASCRAERLLRHDVLDAARLPIKAMVTAGTLLPKQRLGCADINKYYLRTGPNYLRTRR